MYFLFSIGEAEVYLITILGENDTGIVTPFSAPIGQCPDQAVNVEGGVIV